MDKQTDIDSILDIKDEVGRTIRSMTSKVFCAWCLSKMNNVPAFNKDIQDLTRSLQRWVMDTMMDDTKIDYYRRLKALNLV